MDKPDIVITTAKEIFFHHRDQWNLRSLDSIDSNLTSIDKIFKAITKTVSEAYIEAQKMK